MEPDKRLIIQGHQSLWVLKSAITAWEMEKRED